MRSLRYVATRALFLALLVAGLVYDVEGALYCTRFYVGIGLLTGLFARTKDAVSRLAKKGAPPVPVKVAFYADVLLSFFMVWFGAWIMGVAWLFSAGFSAAAGKAAEELNGKEAA